MMNKRIVFFGTPDFAVASLDAIVAAGYDVAAVVTVPDSRSGRGMKVAYSPVKDYALAHQLPLLQPEKLRDPLFLQQLAQYQADVFVVVAFRMLPQLVWAMPPLGTFNLHASLLPQYRGAAPINWAIINGEKETGVTTFLLNDRIDEGHLLLQQSTPISDDDNAETLHDRLAAMGRDLVVKTLDGLFSHSLHPQAQPHVDTLKPAPKIFKPDCLIPWHSSGIEICNFIRGLSPYPAAVARFVNAKGQEVSLKIFNSSFEKCDNSYIGAILTNSKNELKIGVNDGFVRILSVLMSGKKKITVGEFLRGYNVTDWKLII